jgi:hypothetical protein
MSPFSIIGSDRLVATPLARRGFPFRMSSPVYVATTFLPLTEYAVALYTPPHMTDAISR